MPLTVGEVLSLEPFHEAEVIAGEDGFDHVVEHVTVVEVPGVERWGMKGGLLLSTLYAYPDREAQRELVAFLGRRKRAAGLVLHPGGSIKLYHEDMAQEANRYGFPLIRLPVSMSYLAIFQAVYGTLFERQAALLRRSEDINREFTEVILSGRDVKSICDMLYDFVRNPILVLSSDLSRHLAWAGSFSDVQELARAIDDSAELVTGRANKGKEAVVRLSETGESSRFGGVNLHVVPIHAVGELVRFLVVAESSPIDEVAGVAIMHAATALAMDALHERAGLETHRRFVANLLDDLLSGRVTSLESLNQRGDALGINLRNRRVVIYVAAQKPTELSGLTELLAAAEDATKRIDPGAIVTSRGDGVVIVPSFPGGRTRREAAIHLTKSATELENRLRTRGWSEGMIVAVGTLVDDTTELGLSYQTALWVADMQQRLGHQPGPVVGFDDLGVHRLAALDIDDRLLERFVADTLGPIHERGGLDKAELLHTLEVFLDCRESYVAAGERLFIHPNTVKYRIEKLRNMFPKDPLKNDDSRLALHVALKLRKAE